MQSIKKNVLKLIKKLPENATYKQIQYEIYINQQIEEGLEQVEDGQVISNEEAMERLKKWLK
jgi:predicted transcriptional regulator